MKKLFFLTFVGLLFFSCQDSTNEGADFTESEISLLNDDIVSTTSSPIEGQYIVVLNDGIFDAHKPSKSAAKQAILTGNEKEFFKRTSKSILLKFNDDPSLKFSFNKENIKSVYSFAIEGFSAKLSPDEVAELKNDKRVKYITQDRMIALKRPKPPVDPDPEPTGQTIPWGITRVGGSGDGTGTTAWVIDSGIDLDHPDLNVDVSRSISFTGDNNPDDGNGHGTHVAGTIGAIDNEIGVIGVAAGANVVALKVLDDNGNGEFSWTVSALDYVAAVGNAGDAVNMSLGPDTRYIEPLSDAATKSLASLGFKIAIAAGNSYDDSSFYTPAHNNGANIYTVSASAEGDYYAWFSNYGAPVDYIAPGNDIRSTWLNGAYNTIGGTSMASPHVCGLLLLGNIQSGGTASTGAYWELERIRGSYYITGNYSPTDNYSYSVFRPDPDSISEPMAHH